MSDEEGCAYQPQHPHLVLIGDFVSNTSCYLSLYNRKYYFIDPIKAVEVCFSFFCGLNIKYPIECKPIWVFLERLVFNLNITKESFKFIDIFIKQIS